MTLALTAALAALLTAATAPSSPVHPREEGGAGRGLELGRGHALESASVSGAGSSPSLASPRVARARLGDSFRGARELTAAVRESVAAALAVPGARAEVLGVDGALPAGCALARVEVPRPVTASGRVAVRLAGSPVQGGTAVSCDRWAWARVRIFAPALLTTREVGEGAPLEGAVRAEEREVRAGRPPLDELPKGATAARHLDAKTVLDDGLVRVGPQPGDEVTVVLLAGALSVERQGRALPCPRGRACALLPSGKRIEGDWHAGRIEVELP